MQREPIQGKGCNLTSIPKPRSGSIAIPPDDPSFVPQHAHHARVSKPHERAVLFRPGNRSHFQPDVLPVLVPTQVVAALDEGGGQGEGVGGFGDEGAGVGKEGDVEEVFGDAERAVDEDLSGETAVERGWSGERVVGTAYMGREGWDEDWEVGELHVGDDIIGSLRKHAA